jgi:hypothetical protein
MNLHYENNIGYIPLLESMHEKFHNGHLDIPISYVHGNYSYFVTNYFHFLGEGEVATINNFINTTTLSGLRWFRSSDDLPVAVNG